MSRGGIAVMGKILYRIFVSVGGRTFKMMLNVSGAGSGYPIVASTMYLSAPGSVLEQNIDMV